MTIIAALALAWTSAPSALLAPGMAARNMGASTIAAPKRAPAQEPFFEGTGAYGRKITTPSPLAQRYFNQGLNFLFAFNHDEAIRSFQAAAKADPNCAMAYWGIAAANGPHINNPVVDTEHAKAAFAAVTKAELLVKSGTPVEKALVAAQRKRYANPQPADRSALDRAYANAMREAFRKFPRDADVGAFFAESLMDLRPWDLWKKDGTPQPGTPEIVSTLEKVNAMTAKHPFALHLYIHTVETSLDPYRAMDEADRLRNLQPGLGHNVHMPSHIDVRTGRWKEAVIANEKAMAADAAYRKLRPRIGFYRLYMAHNFHMLGFAAMMRGQSAKAIKTIDAMIAAIPTEARKDMAPILDGFMSMPYEVRIRYGKWDDVLAMAELPSYFPISTALRHEARAVAFAAKKMPDKARLEQAMFELAAAKVPMDAFFGNNSGSAILDVARHLMDGEIYAAEEKPSEAIASMKKAVKAEDQLRYDEPPGWILPARHTLGAYLMDRGRYAEAAEVYRADLKIWPENGWSLFGLSDAMTKLGQSAEAAPIRKRFDNIWADADMKISSSCMCLPGG